MSGSGCKDLVSLVGGRGNLVKGMRDANRKQVEDIGNESRSQIHVMT